MFWKMFLLLFIPFLIWQHFSYKPAKLVPKIIISLVLSLASTVIFFLTSYLAQEQFLISLTLAGIGTTIILARKQTA